ncbi:DUF5367 family protein [Wenyingzhuangia sp. IMCC45574]
MKNLLKSILYAILVWLLGVSFYLASFYVPVIENAEFQANLVLAVAIIPSACIGTYLFYRNNRKHPLELATVFVSMAVLLDVLVTVPVFVIPAGGSYSEFFTAISFYLIAAEYFLVVCVFGKYVSNNSLKII